MDLQVSFLKTPFNLVVVKNAVSLSLSVSTLAYLCATEGL